MRRGDGAVKGGGPSSDGLIIYFCIWKDPRQIAATGHSEQGPPAGVQSRAHSHSQGTTVAWAMAATVSMAAPPRPAVDNTAPDVSGVNGVWLAAPCCAAAVTVHSCEDREDSQKRGRAAKLKMSPSIFGTVNLFIIKTMVPALVVVLGVCLFVVFS